MEGYITVNTLEEKWGLSPRAVQVMCAKGRTEGAIKFGRFWVISVNAQRPADGRVFSGKYKDWRKKEE